MKRFWFSSIRFSPDVVPYLYGLKREFTKIDFLQISKLDTPFSFRLYSWLIKYRNLRRHALVETDALDISWMKERTSLSGKYNEYRFFLREVLGPTVELINACTDISVNWEPLKAGRTVMRGFCEALATYDPTRKVALADLKKWLNWSEIIGDDLSVRRLKSEIAKRSVRRRG